jgi:hypothetical protein
MEPVRRSRGGLLRLVPALNAKPPIDLQKCDGSSLDAASEPGHDYVLPTDHPQASFHVTISTDVIYMCELLWYTGPRHRPSPEVVRGIVHVLLEGGKRYV